MREQVGQELREVDLRVTGGNMDRPALQRQINEIDAGKVDCVVARPGGRRR